MKRSVALIAVIGMCLISFSAQLYAWPVPDTGQQKCYDAEGNEINPCPQPSEPFYGQDGNYNINPMSYTKLDANGNELQDDATEWAMVRDNVTGLIWEVKSHKDGIENYDDIHDADNIYSWYDPNPETNYGKEGLESPNDTFDFVTAMNEDKYGGFTDWRLPTIEELMSIMDFSVAFPGPTVNTNYFPNTNSGYSADYWSSMSIVFHYQNHAWHADFGNSMYSLRLKSHTLYVRAVRGNGQKITNRFLDYGNGTITDTQTGLTWEKKTDDGGVRDRDNLYNWHEALQYCNTLTFGNKHEWRLPTTKEFLSIIDLQRKPAIDPVFDSLNFVTSDTDGPGISNSGYWSSTSLSNSTENAFYFQILEGRISARYKDNSSYFMHVLAVHDEKTQPTGESIVAQTPTQAPASANYSQWGNGFTPNATATLYFNKYPEYELIETQTVDIEPDGTFSRPFTPPATESREYLWYAVDDATGLRSSNHVTYIITEGPVPNIMVAPLSGPQGITFDLGGNGFTPNEKATIIVKNPAGNEIVNEEIDINSDGGIQYSLEIAEDAPTGEYMWWAVDNATDFKAVEMTFAVTDKETSLTPATPTSPENHAEIAASSYIFEWTHPYNDEYELTIKDETGATVIHREGITAKSLSIDLTTLEADNWYKWTVTVHSRGLSQESAESFFTYKGPQSDITPPTLVSPDDNDNITDSTVSFVWTHPFNDEYELFIKDAEGNEVFKSGKITDKSQTVALSEIPLQPGEQYKWYVLVYANDTIGPSEDRFFTYNGPVISPDYRITEIPAAPNGVLQIPAGGYGYAWFIAEKRVGDQEWQPVPESTKIVAKVKEGQEIICSVNQVPYQTFESDYDLRSIPGLFAVSIPSYLIGDIGEEGKVTVREIAGMELLPENRQTVDVLILPYTYKANWGYRVYGKAGVGAMVGVAEGTAFAGGGAGARLQIELEGMTADAEWNSFEVSRRHDLFVGVDAKLGPPSLIDTNLVDMKLGPKVQLKASFPYEETYKFTLHNMGGLESALAFYLFQEPMMASLPIKTTQFLSWLAEFLIQQSGILEVYRVSDETGLDLGSSGELAGQFGVGTSKNNGLSSGASLGAESHAGNSIKKSDNEVEKAIYAMGRYSFDLGVGLKGLIGKKDHKSKLKYAFPGRLVTDLLDIPSDIQNEYKSMYIENSGEISYKITHSKGSSYAGYNIYDLPLDYQRYTSIWHIYGYQVINLLQDSTAYLYDVRDIGLIDTEFSFSNTTFEKDFTQFLTAVYDNQIVRETIRLPYELRADTKKDWEFDLSFKFPIPAFPALFVKVGAGVKGVWGNSYILTRGNWFKGVPLLQEEIPGPPYSNETLFNVLDKLWQKIVDNVGDELADLILDNMINTIIDWFDRRSGVSPRQEIKIIALDEKGSTITLTAQSLPAGVDSMVCRFWEWEGEENENLSVENRRRLRRFRKAVRDARQESFGAHYGVGGFFSIEPHDTQFGGETTLTITYTEAEAANLDETELTMYWEDENAQWHPMTSDLDADANTVSAELTESGTFTLAPRMPQGEFDLLASPESIPNDGESKTTVTSADIYNNDDTLIPDGMVFNVQISRGEIVSIDADDAMDGFQVETFDGKVQVEIGSDLIPQPIEILISSDIGSAYGRLEIPVYDVNTPAVPQAVEIQTEEDGVRIRWQAVGAPDLAGYHIWFDTDGSGQPYDGVLPDSGASSPITVGVDDEYVLTGFADDATVYVAVSAFDVAGSESDLSEEVSAGVSPPAGEDLIAEAGSSQSVTEGATVSLNGSSTTTGASITYQWTQTAGPSVALTDADSIQASFTAPDVADGSETLTFRLTVSDADGNTASDTCTVTVSAQNAGEGPDDDHDGPGDTNNCFINSVFH